MMISKRLQQVGDSLTLALNARVKAMQEAGDEVLNLTAGELDVDTDEGIKQGAINALNLGLTRYTPVPGIPSLRSAIARQVSARTGVSCLADEVMVTVGAKQGCYQAMAGICDLGDEMILPVPYWVSYPEMASLLGIKSVFAQTKAKDDWKITPEIFSQSISEKTKLLVLNSPNNPTGAVYSQEELKALAEIALEKKIFILFDAIYEDFVYSQAVFGDFFALGEEVKSLTIRVGGFSKAWAMTGWRLGYVVADSVLIKAMSKMQAHSTANATSFAQYGALEAFTQGVNFPQKMRQKYEKRLALVLDKVGRIERVNFSSPQGAFYLWLDISALGMKSGEFCEKLLEKEKVALVPGVCFGDDRAVRLSYCVDEKILMEAVDRIEKFIRVSISDR